ncbi:MAG: threonine ammonia-lyase, biosynthetic [Chlorobia bacterium]|nr:threonine ammonia-lyase, biosynthetic [Fimbriimonadaceae bacterium]
MKDAVLKAALLSRVYEVARETPLEYAPALSKRIGNRVWLKREDEQPVFSFKIRGAFNKMASLPPAVLERGVVASSAGNHAQGVALSAHKLGCRAVIVMPITTPTIKVEAVKSWGAEVVLFGDNYDEAYSKARELEKSQGLAFIHPYDDPAVIAGQGTIAIEILRQLAEPIHAVYVAVGGGGLISGVGAVIKELRPEVRIIGVEPEDCDAMAKSLRAGQVVTLEHVGRFADGVAVKRVGDLTFQIAKEVVDEMVIVSNDEICAAMKDIFEDRRCILEPAGALAYAGLKRHALGSDLKEKNLVAIACGANLNFDSLRHVSERAEIGEKREAILAVTIPERPGSFLQFCRVIGSRSVTEFNYRYENSSEAHVFAGVRIANRDEADHLIAELRSEGYEIVDLTDNELAKLHIRHMVGGRSPGAENERLFQVSFPERSGALLSFLEGMSASWNISLFHYRNHGSDYGRVLIGVQVPVEDNGVFKAFLEKLGHQFSEETENAACRLFLR